jgi:hypothetical protein
MMAVYPPEPLYTTERFTGDVAPVIIAVAPPIHVVVEAPDDPVFE